MRVFCLFSSWVGEGSFHGVFSEEQEAVKCILRDGNMVEELKDIRNYALYLLEYEINSTDEIVEKRVFVEDGNIIFKTYEEWCR